MICRVQQHANCRTGGAVPRLGFICLLALVLLPFGENRVAAHQPSRDLGRAIAERECAHCHAVGRTGTSPHVKAPPFRDLPQRYPVQHLAESLAEGIVVGHGDMPEFIFEPDDIDALLAYIASFGP